MHAALHKARPLGPDRKASNESAPVWLTNKAPLATIAAADGRGQLPCLIIRNATHPSSSARRSNFASPKGTTCAAVARELGCDPGSLSDRVKTADGSGCEPDANPFQTAEGLRRLKRENERLKRENEILLIASAFFASRQLQPRLRRRPSSLSCSCSKGPGPSPKCATPSSPTTRSGRQSRGTGPPRAASIAATTAPSTSRSRYRRR